MNFWHLYWALYLLGGGAVVETIALIRKKRGDTLSEAVWSWFKVEPGQPVSQWGAVHVLGLLIFVAIGIWLTVHFFTGDWR